MVGSLLLKSMLNRKKIHHYHAGKTSLHENIYCYLCQFSSKNVIFQEVVKMAESGNSSMRRVAQASLPGAHPHPHPSHPHEPIPLPYHWHEKQVNIQYCIYLSIDQSILMFLYIVYFLYSFIYISHIENQKSLIGYMELGERSVKDVLSGKVVSGQAQITALLYER